MRGKVGVRRGLSILLLIFVATSFYMLVTTFANPGPLNGYVTKIEGGGLVGVNVTIYNTTDGSLVASNLTDSNGYYIFPAIDDWEYNVTYTLAEYIQRNVTVNNSVTPQYNISLYREGYGSYNVTVLDAWNMRPIPNAIVNITWENKNNTKTTDSNGVVILEVPGNVSGGQKVIHSFKVSSTEGYNANTTHIDSVLEGSNNDVTMYLKGSCTIYGYVRDEFREAAYDEIADALVEAWNNNNIHKLNFSNSYFYNYTSDSGGYYSISIPTTLLGGACNPYMHTSATGYITDTESHTTGAGELIILLTGAAHIEGTVLDKNNQSYGVNGSTVNVISNGTTNTVYKTTANTNGYFNVSVKNLEDRRIEIERSGYITTSNITVINITTDYGNINMTGKGTLTGTLADIQNSSIKVNNVNVSIIPTNPGSAYLTQTDANGVFAINVSTDPNVYTITFIDKPGYYTNQTSSTFTLDGTGTNNLGTIMLTGKNQVDGTVYDINNMQDHTVDSVGITITGGGLVYADVNTSSSGYYKMNIPSTLTPYTVQFDKAGYNLTAVSSTTTNNNTMDAYLDGATHMSGQVTDSENSQPIDSALISFYNQATGITYYNTTTSSTGNYSIDLGVDFNFSIMINKTGYYTFTNGTYQWDQQRVATDIVSSPGLTGSTHINITVMDEFNSSIFLDNVDICILYSPSFSTCRYTKTTLSNGNREFDIQGSIPYRIRLDKIGYPQKFIPGETSSMLGNYSNTTSLSSHAAIIVKDKYAVAPQQAIPNATVYLYKNFNATTYQYSLNETIVNVNVTCNNSQKNGINVSIEGVTHLHYSSDLTANDERNVTLERIPTGNNNLTVDGSNAGCGIYTEIINIPTGGEIYNYSYNVDVTQVQIKVVDPLYNIIAGATVQLADNTSFNCTTPANGICIINYSLAGARNFTGNAANYSATNKSYNVTAGIFNDFTSDPLVLDSVQGSLNILVLNESGNGLGNINVTISNSTDTNSSLTSSDGWANFTSLVGFFNITLNGTLQGYNYSFLNNTYVISNSSTTVNATIAENIVNVRVIDEFGNVNASNVTFFNSTGQIAENALNEGMTNLTNASGRVIFRKIVPGTYTLNTSKPGYTNQSQSVTLYINVNNITIALNDTTPPTYTSDNISNSSPNQGDSISIYAYWEDNAYLSQALLQLNETAGSISNTSSGMTGKNSWSNFTLTSTYTNQNVGKTISYKIVARDLAGNWNTTMPLRNFTIRDSEVPQVSISYQPLNPNGLDLIYFTASATDNINLSQIDIYLDYRIVKSCTNINLASYVCNYTTPEPLLAGSKHYYYAVATDTTGNIGRDPSDAEQIQVKSATLTSAARGLAAAYSPVDQRIYVFGGWTGSAYLNNIDYFDPGTDSLSASGTTMPYAEGISAAFESYNNEIIIFGGFNDTYQSQVLRYNMSANTIQYNANALPSTRASTSAAYDSVNNDLMVFGGYSTTTNYTNDTVLYDPSDFSVSDEGAGLPSPRSWAPAVYDKYNGSIFIFGGYNGSNLTEIVHHDVTGPHTSTLLPTSLPAGMYGMSAAFYEVNNLTYIIGGCDELNRTRNTVYRFNSSSMEINLTGVTLPNAMCHAAAVFNPVNNTILIFGGFDFDNYYDTILEYTPITAKAFIVDPLAYYTLTVNVRDMDGSPLENVVVTAGSSSTNTTVAGIATMNLLADNYTVTTDGSATGYGVNMTDVELLSDVSIIVNLNTTILTVNVTDNQSTPLENANVTLYQDSAGTQPAYDALGNPVTGYTDSSGLVTFTRLIPCSNCNITVNKTTNYYIPNVEPEYNSTLVTINAGDNLTVHIDPEETLIFNETFSLNFTINNGDPNADNISIVVKYNSTGVIAGQNLTTNGSCLITGIQTGYYDFIINGSIAGFSDYILTNVGVGRIIRNSGTTGLDGRVTITMEGSGFYYIYVDSNGYFNYDDIQNGSMRVGTYDSNAVGTSLNDTVTVELTGGSTLNGVVEDENFYQPFNTSYEPINQSSVNIYTAATCSSGIRYTITTTDNGSYSIPVSTTVKGTPSNQTYWIQSVSTGFDNSDCSSFQDLQFNSTREVNVSQQGNSTMSGYAKNAETLEPIYNAEITLKSSGCYNSPSAQCNAYHAYTDSLGFFTFKVNPNNHTLQYAPYTVLIDAINFIQNESAVPSVPWENAVYYLTPAGGGSLLEISVTSSDGQNITSVVEITLDGSVISSSHSDCYQIGNVLTCVVEQGQYSLVVNGSTIGYGENSTPGLSIGSGTTSLGIILGVTQFNATLYEDNYIGLQNVTVSVNGSSYTNTSNTTNGIVIFSRIPTGTYTIDFTGNNTDIYSFNRTNNGTFTVSSPGTENAVAYILNETRANITLLMENGTGATELNITLTHLTTLNSFTNATDSNGRVYYTKIPHGNYSLVLDNDMYNNGFTPTNTTIYLLGGEKDTTNNTFNITVYDINITFNLLNTTGGGANATNVSILLDGAPATSGLSQALNALTDESGIAIFNNTIPTAYAGGAYTYDLKANSSGYGDWYGNALTVGLVSMNVTRIQDPLSVNVSVHSLNGSPITETINITVFYTDWNVSRNALGQDNNGSTSSDITFRYLFVTNYTVNITVPTAIYNSTINPVSLTTINISAANSVQNITFSLKEVGKGYFNISVTDGTSPLNETLVYLKNSTSHNISSGTTNAGGLLLLETNVSKDNYSLTLESFRTGCTAGSAGPYNASDGILINVTITMTCEEEEDPPPDSCFPAGTMIRMADGSEKPIEDVRIGERVLGHDLRTDKSVVVEVLELESPVREGYYIISFEDSTELHVTNEHPIYIRKEGYEGWGSIIPEVTLDDAGMVVKKIDEGDYVLKIGGWVKITDIEYVEGEVKTYNLKRVSGTNTFFADNILVHNKGETSPPGGGSPSGGGSSTGGGACTEDWTCISWSACTDGIQNRTCTDGNKCGTTTSKPAEKQACGAAMELSIPAIYVNPSLCTTVNLVIKNTGSSSLNNVDMGDAIDIQSCCTLTPAKTITSIPSNSQSTLPITVCSPKFSQKGNYQEIINVTSDEASKSITAFIYITKTYTEVLLDQIAELQAELDSYDRTQFDFIQASYYNSATQALEQAIIKAEETDYSAAEELISKASDYAALLKEYQPFIFLPWLLFVIPVGAIIMLLIWYFRFKTPSTYRYKPPKTLPFIRKSKTPKGYPMISRHAKRILLGELDKLNDRISRVNISRLGDAERHYYKLARDAISNVRSHIMGDNIGGAKKELTEAERHIKSLESGVHTKRMLDDD
jgi:hypothetical protein